MDSIRFLGFLLGTQVRGRYSRVGSLGWMLAYGKWFFGLDASLKSKLFPDLELKDFHQFHQGFLRFFWKLKCKEGTGNMVL